MTISVTMTITVTIMKISVAQVLTFFSAVIISYGKGSDKVCSKTLPILKKFTKKLSVSIDRARATFSCRSVIINQDFFFQ